MEPDTLVRCGICGTPRSVSFLEAVRDGWPRCCDAAMHLEQTAVVVVVALAHIAAEEQTVRGRLQQSVDMRRN